jgi:hypothetical protein
MNITQASDFNYKINFILDLILQVFVSCNKFELLALAVLLNYIITLVRMTL